MNNLKKIGNNSHKIEKDTSKLIFLITYKEKESQQIPEYMTENVYYLSTKEDQRGGGYMVFLLDSISPRNSEATKEKTQFQTDDTVSSAQHYSEFTLTDHVIL